MAQADHLEFRHRDGSLTLAVPRPDCTPIPGDVSPDGSLDSLVGRVVRAVRRWHPVDGGGEVDFDTGDLGLEFDGFDARLHVAADSEIAVRISALGGIEHAQGVPFDTWWAFDSSYPVGAAPSMVGSTILAVERDAGSGVVHVVGSAATLTLSVTASGLRVEPNVRVRVQAIPW